MPHAPYGPCAFAPLQRHRIVPATRFTGAHAGGFVLTRQEAAGKWGKATYSLAARNATFLLALILIASPVAGLRPMRAPRFLTCKMPRPAIRIRSPFLRCLAARLLVHKEGADAP
jgi:hypothetical protein